MHSGFCSVPHLLAQSLNHLFRASGMCLLQGACSNLFGHITLLCYVMLRHHPLESLQRGVITLTPRA